MACMCILLKMDSIMTSLEEHVYIVLMIILLIGGIERNPGPKNKSRLQLVACDISDKMSTSNKELKESNEQLQSEIQEIEEKVSKIQANTKHNFELDLNRIQDVNTRFKKLEQRVRKNYFAVQDFYQETDTRISTLSNLIDNMCAKMEIMRQSCEQMKDEIYTTKCEAAYLKKEINKLIYKENPFKIPFIEGLNEQIQIACQECDWKNCIKYLKEYLSKNSAAYRQLRYINIYENLPQYAARNGYTEMLKVLLKNGLNVNDTSSLRVRNHMLHQAAGYGQNEVVKLLIERGAEVDAVDVSHYTPLHYASLNGHLDTVKLLLEEGANVNAYTSSLYTPLFLAESCGHTSVINYIKEYKRKKGNTSTTMYVNIFVGAAVLYYCLIYLPRFLEEPAYWW